MLSSEGGNATAGTTNGMNNLIKLAFCKMAKTERTWTVKGSLLMRNAIMTMPDAVICSINTFGFLGHIALTIKFWGTREAR